ncbi:hypothetical protein FACS1894102_6910 [Spirochaetia bacterium]|nr:hypothetical protein FACS1894102_6910 [Spirochaetia bacterium]
MQKLTFTKQDQDALRVYAILCLVVSIVLLVVNITTFDADMIRPIIIFSIAANTVCTIMSLVLVLQPCFWQLFTTLLVIHGLKMGLWGGDVLGLIFYATGWIIAYKAGFFAKIPIVKLWAHLNTHAP